MLVLPRGNTGIGWCPIPLCSSVITFLLTSCGWLSVEGGNLQELLKTHLVPMSLSSQKAPLMLFRIPATSALMGVTPTRPVALVPGHSSPASAPSASEEMGEPAMVQPLILTCWGWEIGEEEASTFCKPENWVQQGSTDEINTGGHARPELFMLHIHCSHG